MWHDSSDLCSQWRDFEFRWPFASVTCNLQPVSPSPDPSDLRIQPVSGYCLYFFLQHSMIASLSSSPVVCYGWPVPTSSRVRHICPYPVPRGVTVLVPPPFAVTSGCVISLSPDQLVAAPLPSSKVCWGSSSLLPLDTSTPDRSATWCIYTISLFHWTSSSTMVCQELPVPYSRGFVKQAFPSPVGYVVDDSYPSLPQYVTAVLYTTPPRWVTGLPAHLWPYGQPHPFSSTHTCYGHPVSTPHCFMLWLLHPTRLLL